MYKFFVVLLLKFVFSASAIATSLLFDGENDRASFFATQAAEGSVVQLTFKGQEIDSEFSEKLENFLKHQTGITTIVFEACDFPKRDFHYLTHLGQLESFAMTNCDVDPEMAGIVLANLDGYTVTSINFSGNHLLDAASKSIVGGKFGGTIIWGDGTSAFE